MAIKTHLIRVGNSRGVRLPKAVLQQCDLDETVELEVRGGCVVIRPVRSPRQSWDAAFASMAEAGDDGLLDPDAAPLTLWDREEWQW